MPETSKAPDVKRGDAVVVVGARGEQFKATVTNARKGGLIDVTLDESEQVITSSPFDAEGKRPDCWYVPEPEKKAAKDEAKA